MHRCPERLKLWARRKEFGYRPGRNNPPSLKQTDSIEQVKQVQSMDGGYNGFSGEGPEDVLVHLHFRYGVQATGWLIE